MKWGLDVVASVTGGTASGEAVISSFVIDSRDSGPGTLFVALEGEHRDGHDFAPQALEAGAAVLVKAGSLPPNGIGVEVDDPLTALIALATRRRAELLLPVVAITGSNGKTTTKDLLAGALGSGAHKSPRSFNNEIGVPLTILGVPEYASSVVVEVGSRGRGHIELLAPMIRPDVAVITNVARAHLETFGSEDAIVEAKWELVEALDARGIAVLPIGDERLVGRRTGNVMTFGEDPSADVAVSGVAVGSDGRASCTLTHGGISVDTRLAVVGRHQPVNLAAAVAAAVAMGREFESAVKGGASAVGSAWRMEVHPGPVTIVNDAYNANPDSMAASLATIAAMPGRHVAVLGRMHELGESEIEGHREVGALARSLGFAAVVVVGEDPGIADGAGPIARRVTDPEQARAVLSGYLMEGDIVLVKASRAEGLEVLADWLRRDDR